MPSTPFDSAHQKNLRALIGKVLPDARSQHIAEAVGHGIDGKFFCESLNRVERRRIGCAFEKADIVSVDSGTMRQFLLRKPTRVSQSP